MTPPTPAMTAQEALALLNSRTITGPSPNGIGSVTVPDHDIRRAASVLSDALSDAERRATEWERDWRNANQSCIEHLQRIGEMRDFLAEVRGKYSESQSRLSAVAARCGLMREALGRIQRRAAPTPDRNFDGVIRDIMWIDDEARTIIAYPGGKSEEPTERAQIVAWIMGDGQKQLGVPGSLLGPHWTRKIADAIARGEHLPGGKSDQGEKEKPPIDILSEPHKVNWLGPMNYANSEWSKSNPPAGGEGKPEPVAWRHWSGAMWFITQNWLEAQKLRKEGIHVQALYPAAAPLSRSGDSALVEARKLLKPLADVAAMGLKDDWTVKLCVEGKGGGGAGIYVYSKNELEAVQRLAEHPEIQQHGERK